MSSQDAKQIEFNFLSDLPVLVQQHEGQLTSDAGLLPIAQFDRRLNYTARMAAWKRESNRGPGRAGAERVARAENGATAAGRCLG